MSFDERPAPSQRDLANAIRFLTVDTIEAAGTGHPGTAMGMADIAEVLWNRFLKHNPTDPSWIGPPGPVIRLYAVSRRRSSAEGMGHLSSWSRSPYPLWGRPLLGKDSATICFFLQP